MRPDELDELKMPKYRCNKSRIEVKTPDLKPGDILLNTRSGLKFIYGTDKKLRIDLSGQLLRGVPSNRLNEIDWLRKELSQVLAGQITDRALRKTFFQKEQSEEKNAKV